MPLSTIFQLYLSGKFSVCEISSRPVDNVYVKSSWSMSNFQKKII